MTIAFAFDNSYARLPDRFYARLAPTPVAAPALVKLNVPLARSLGLDPAALASPAGVAVLAGNAVPPGADPLAMAYAGHQFGSFTPQLGDGRAILLGEVVASDGTRLDVQLKGSGPTPFSRRGDGRAALGPVLREYVISEAMHALGLPTTRSLAAVTTGEPVLRQQVLPGAVLTRIAQSHIRVGTFEWFGSRQDLDALRTLADYTIQRLAPEAAAAANPYRALLDVVIRRQAELIARWLGIGFIHGVMNTDNMALSGETIDYGPCAFMDAYDPATVYSSIDEMGRYAFANQPRIANWNLARLAQAMLPLLAGDEDQALAEGQAAVDAFPEQFQAAWQRVFRAKLGLARAEEGDVGLIHELLTRMAEQRADYTNTFRALATGDGSAARGEFEEPSGFDAWYAEWRRRLEREDGEPAARMRTANPAVIPRNHQVERALGAAEAGDLAPLDALLGALADPYAEPADPSYTRPPAPHEVVRATFCGT
ncbi:MAG: YdiU family protein [Geminicoccaceae bacterium]|nr:MAG: YdiU family protein [Geminicoccaceae bacterium]